MLKHSCTSNWFLSSVPVLLFVTGLAKLISGLGKAPILSLNDPIFGLAFRYIFWVVGTIELLVAAFCALANNPTIKATLIAWLSTAFAIYRLGLHWIGYEKPCSCLGNLTDALHLPPQIVDGAMKVALGYLLIGSYSLLVYTQVRPAQTILTSKTRDSSTHLTT